MNIVQAAGISENFGWVAGFRKRTPFADLSAYLKDGRNGQLCVLYGLKRTGKSVMMFQAMLERQLDSAYILCDSSDSADNLADAMHDLRGHGIRNFFIDEVTLLPDFLDECQFLADLGANGARVVLAGTDSLSFDIAKHAEFAGRMRMVHTTFIPFAEHRRLLGTASLDEYAKRGGILSDPEDFDDYPLSAIALNIQNSLMNSQARDFMAIGRLCREGKLATLIHQIVRDENHRFTLDAMRKAWRSAEFFRTRNDIQSVPDFVRKIDPERLMRRTRRRLGITEDGRISPSPQELYEINQYLQKLELVRPALVVSEADLAALERLDGENRQEAMLVLMDKLSYETQSRNLDDKWLFTQPGLRWSQVEALLLEMRKDIEMMPGIRKDEINQAFAMIGLSAMGSLMEEIVVNETSLFRKDAVVFKYLPLDGDIDMVVSGSGGLRIFEIKHSGSQKAEQSRHLRNKRNVSLLKGAFGSIAETSVIYTGKAGREFGVNYINVNDYLLNLQSATQSKERPNASARRKPVF